MYRQQDSTWLWYICFVGVKNLPVLFVVLGVISVTVFFCSPAESFSEDWSFVRTEPTPESDSESDMVFFTSSSVDWITVISSLRSSIKVFVG